MCFWFNCYYNRMVNIVIISKSELKYNGRPKNCYWSCCIHKQWSNTNTNNELPCIVDTCIGNVLADIWTYVDGIPVLAPIYPCDFVNDHHLPTTTKLYGLFVQSKIRPLIKNVGVLASILA